MFQKYKLIFDNSDLNSQFMVFDTQKAALDHVRDNKLSNTWSVKKEYDTQFVKSITDEELLTEYDSIRSAMSFYNAAEGNWSAETAAREETQQNLNLIKSEVELRNLTPNPGNFLL